MRKNLLLLFFSLGAGLWAQTSLGQTSLHPAFTLTAATLAPLVQNVPAPYRKAILANPTEFLTDYLPLLSAPFDLLVLVDKNTALPDDYEPKDLALLKTAGVTVNRNDLKFRKAYFPAIQALNKAAAKQGHKLLFSSAYRSWIYQRDLFQGYVNKDGVATADRYSARAGHSQHQLGTVVDFGSITPAFGFTPEGQWLANYAGDYGFSMSYPKDQEPLTGYTFESWHFRYIGVDACKVQKKWFGDLQQLLLVFHAQAGDSLKAARAAKGLPAAKPLPLATAKTKP